jgi:hypothetical protein
MFPRPLLPPKGETGLRSLRNAKIGRVSNVVRVGHPGCQQRVVEEISPVDRQVDYLPVVDHRGLLGSAGLNHLTPGHNLNSNLESRCGQAKWNCRLLTNRQLDLHAAGSKPLRLNPDLVAARQKPDEDVATTSVRHPAARNTFGKIDDRNPSPGDNCAILICHIATQLGGRS